MIATSTRSTTRASWSRTRRPTSSCCCSNASPSGAKLAALADDAAARQKPIVLLKLGRTEAGSRAAASHTGAITGSDAVHDAAFRRHGIIRVDDCHELYETAMLLRDRARRPRGRAVAAMAISGGNAVQLADLGASLGLHWPDYGAATQQRLAEFMPSIGKIGNPTDLTAAAIGKGDTFGAALEIIADDEAVDTMLPILTFASRAEIERVRDFARTAPKPVGVLWTGGCNDDRCGLAADLRRGGGAAVPRRRTAAARRQPRRWLRRISGPAAARRRSVRRGSIPRRPARRLARAAER